MRRILALIFPLSLAFLVVSKGAEWISDVWWFGALNQGATWWDLMGWRAGAFVVVAPLWGAIVGWNLRLAWRHALAQRAPLSLLGGALGGIELEMSPALRFGRWLIQVSVWSSAWLAGLAAANRFDLWLLALRGNGLGQFEASAGLDLGFFLFRLPAIYWAWSLLGVALGLTLTGCLCLYLWLDTIETGPGVLRASEFARTHLCGLSAAFVIWKGGDCALNVVGAPIVFGWTPKGILGFPEQIAGVPADQFFAWSALPLAAFLVWCGARERGRIALFGALGWGTLALIVPALAPAFVRSLGVMNETRQRQAVVAHLDATRRAWGFAGVKEVRIKSDAAFAATQLGAPAGANPQNPPNAPVALWPVEAARRAMQEQLGDATPLRVTRVHTARENQNQNQALWLRAIAARRDSTGEAAAIQLQAPASSPGPLLVQQQALDDNLLPEASAPPSNNRLGPAPDPLPPLPLYRLTARAGAGVERSTLGACLVLATRFFDVSLLRPGLPLTWHLEPVERAQMLAPFVNWSGAVARPVVLESGVGPHVYWLVEGCFTSRSFPGAATLPTGDTWGGINYARQGVVAVLDGSSGQSQFFLTAPNEPLSRAWARALPALWTPLDQLRPELRAQLQPSTALLEATTRVYASYHPQTGDQVMAWQTHASEWRPILTEDTGSGAWSEALLPDEKGAPVCWQLGAFAPARGLLETGKAPVTLSALAGVTLAPDGQAQWRQWQPDKPLPLPDIAAEPTVSFNPEGRPTVPPPTRIGVFPAFDARGRANGFTVFRAEISAPEPSDAQTPDNPTKTADPTTSSAVAPPRLKVQAQTTGTPTLAAPDSAEQLTALARATQLWRAILLARRAGQWSRAVQLETQLGATLNAPAPTPTARPTAVATPERAAP